MRWRDFKFPWKKKAVVLSEVKIGPGVIHLYSSVQQHWQFTDGNVSWVLRKD